MLAMGAQVFDRPEDLMIARGLLETCVYMYQSSATGLCPERWTYYELTTETFNGRTYNKTKQQIRRDQYLIFHPQAREEELAEHERLMAAKENMYGDPPPPLEEDKINVLHPNRPQRPIYRGGGGDVMYLLRPETVESIFILYRITGDPKYQEYGWDIFQAIEKYCKTSTAYTSIRTVEFVPSEDEDIESNQMDSMERYGRGLCYKMYKL
jgi:mannosyl-oligosaccharide alpha-1,2-mannosidase